MQIVVDEVFAILIAWAVFPGAAYLSCKSYFARINKYARYDILR